MSGRAHRLEAIVTSFTGPGYRAECSCGWRSMACESLPEAAFEFRKHQEPADESASASPSEEGR